MELDRQRQRYDVVLKKNPLLAKQLDGDYYGSKWDKTGVIEVDCFFCHLEGYNPDERNKQLSALNFKWATVAASGIGQVYGSVKEGDVPKVEYNHRLFNNDGRIALSLNRKPDSENCSLCHASIDAAKRGTLWADRQNPDVHKIAGMTCVDCHFSELDHNFAKGEENVSTVRDDLDNTIISCNDCHSLGHMGAPPLKHFSIRDDHLKKIDCTTCHIPFIPKAATAAIVVGNGEIVHYAQPSNISGHLRTMNRQPGYERNFRRDKENGKIRPVNYLQPVVFTNQDENGIHYPLFLKEVRKGYNLYLKRSTEFKHGNVQVYQSTQEIGWILKDLTTTLEGNGRFRKIKPFHHKGGYVYSLNKTNEVIKEIDTTWVGNIEGYSISHNVAPAKNALGAGGCSDCHSDNSAIFNGVYYSDIFGPDGGVMEKNPPLGYSSAIQTANRLFNIHLNVITPYFSAGLLTLVLLLLLHLTLLQPNIADFLQEPAEFKLFNRAEHWSFLLKMMIFLFLVAMGHIVYFTKLGMLSVFISLYKKALVFAGVVGVIVLIASVIALVIWIRGGYFGPYDKEWVKKLRDSLETGLDHDVKGRLSISQKVLFWLMNLLALITVLSGLLLVLKQYFSVAFVLILSSLHGFIAIMFIAVVLTRAYIVGIVNPSQVWHSLVDTKISRDWAKKHHDGWHKSIK